MIWFAVLRNMGAHMMKTTIDINDELAQQAKAMAARRGTTFRSIVEHGIRLALEEASRSKPYRLDDKSVQGSGLQADFRDRRWAEIREAAYGDRSRW